MTVIVRVQTEGQIVLPTHINNLLLEIYLVFALTVIILFQDKSHVVTKCFKMKLLFPS